MASPWTTAMVACREPSIRRSTGTTPASGSLEATRASISFRSRPEQKAGPAPRNTITRTSLRASRLSMLSPSRRSIAAFIALRCSGRLSVTVATPSATAIRISSDMARWYHPVAVPRTGDHESHLRGPRQDRPHHAQPARGHERDGRRGLRGALEGVGGRARQPGRVDRGHHRRGRSGVHRRRRSQVADPAAARAGGLLAHAEEHDPQSRAGGLEAGDRGGQRLLPGRRHDAAVRHRHPDRRRARRVRDLRGQARDPARQRRYAARAPTAAVRDRHGDAAARPATDRRRGALLRARQRRGAR